jgi:hypothetical protein
VLDSCGKSGTGETPEAKLRRLTARPAESEHLQRKGTVSVLLNAIYRLLHPIVKNLKKRDILR